jgi:hypothetical protein
MTVLSIVESNLSVAWAKAFLTLMNTGGGQVHPAMITIQGIDSGKPLEDQRIRDRLDRELKIRGESLSGTISGTIFPSSMWNPALPNNADVLFQRYKKAWPGISKCPANRNGVYFRRLTAFHPKNAQGEAVNQMEFIINTYHGGNHRKSALQAAILDPTRDHTNSRQKGFPCLQQIAFTPLDGGGMSVTGFYATQYQFEKAYGNYLGLHGIGQFMAKQLGLTLTHVICIATVLKLGNPGKGELRDLASDISTIIEEHSHYSTVKD